MKVTYRQNRFEIDGVPVINPEVIAYQKDGCWYEAYYRNGAHWAVFEGNEFDLPDNIECEIVEVRCVKPCDEYRKKCSPDGCKFPKKVYRLKLKEPLVGSKANIAATKLGTAFEVVGDNLLFIESKTPTHTSHLKIMDSGKRAFYCVYESDEVIISGIAPINEAINNIQKYCTFQRDLS